MTTPRGRVLTQAAALQGSVGAGGKAPPGDVLVGVDAVDAVRPWEPYEASPKENYLLPFMPLQFYQLRWAIMRCNPLTWTVGRRSFTYGEAILFTLVLAQMAWVALMWGLHPEFRVDVVLTGALAPPPRT